MSQRADYGAAALSAGLYQLAYPPFHLVVPSFVCLTPVLVRLMAADAHRRPVRRLLGMGLALGLLLYGLGLTWMGEALWRMHPQWIAAYPAVVLALAACTSLVFAAVGWVRRMTRLPVVLLFPIFWTAFEILVGHQRGLGFPWLGLGTSLTGFPLLVQIADIIGARGVTFLLAAANAALAVAWLHRRTPRAALRQGAAVAAGTAIATGYGAYRTRTMVLEPGPRVVVVQPSIEPTRKWDPRFGDYVMDVLASLSVPASREPGADLIAWPETAVPGALQEHPAWAGAVAELARRSQVPILAGALDASTVGSSRQYYNAAFLFEGGDPWTAHPVYRKRQPVPLVERPPRLMGWVGRGGMGALAAGGDGPLYSVAGYSFGVLICYEAAFEAFTRQYRRSGARFVVNLSNDAWFGNGFAAYQHPSHLVMRAIEDRVGIVRVANSGFSEFINPLGAVSERSALNQRTLVASSVLVARDRSVYSRLGDWVGLLSLVTAAGLCVAAAYRFRQVGRRS